MNIKKYIIKICKDAASSSQESALYNTSQKNNLLKEISNNINSDRKNIIKANSLDIKNFNIKNSSNPMMDRLMLNDVRISAMCDGINKVIKIPDHLYKIVGCKKQPSGITVCQMRVPLGVIGMIYESRPNVTIDAAALCIKSGNSVILRGGSEAINTNKRLMLNINKAIKKHKVNSNIVQLVSITEREAVTHMLNMDKYIDIIIPRGGKGLVQKISSNSKIPTIKHLDGNCHIYIDKKADPRKALTISLNAKTQRYGVCNAMETLLIHKDFSKAFTKKIINLFKEKSVEIRGCNKTKLINKNIKKASSLDWSTEFLAPIVAIKIVDNIDEAINHIEKFGSRHTDGIISMDKLSIEKFSKMVNSSSVMINTSTRFADGFEYGLGAEIGISTDKLHARGPVGVDGLTSVKYVVKSQGKSRD